MARIIPFNAAHYNNIRFGNEAMRFVAPPYDVIDKATERRLKDDRLNIAYITLGDENDGYATAAKRLRRWLNDEVMVVDRDESLYLYEQTFQGMDGIVRVRTGMIAVVRLEEFSTGVILPHENTIPKHKADRMALMEAIRGDAEQIFMLFNDPSGEIERTIDESRKSEEMLRFIDVQGVHHRIIRVRDEETTRRLCELIRPETILIADGHHRYETALEYWRDRRGREEGASGYVLATLVSSRNPGLVISPTHRLVEEVEDEVLEVISEQLREDFEVTDFESHVELLKAMDGAEDGAFGVWSPSAGIRALAVPKEKADESGPLANLSVFVLQEKVLKGMLGFTAEMLDKKKNIDYVKEPEVAVSKVASGEHSVCFFVKAPTVEQVMNVAKAGLKMPHKSTYFFPKVWSGTLLYLFDEQASPANGKYEKPHTGQ